METNLTGKGKQSQISRGIQSLSLTLIPYALSEMVSAYGFIAVFVAACAFGNSEQHAKHMDNLHDFTEEIEHIFMTLIFVMIGLYLAAFYDKLTDIRIVAVAAATIFVIRPLAGWISYTRATLTNYERFFLSFYGIRGIGSIFYLAYALGESEFPGARLLIHSVAAIIILSAFVHGITATLATNKLDRIEKD